jgi:hypothetical protein
MHFRAAMANGHRVNTMRVEGPETAAPGMGPDPAWGPSLPGGRLSPFVESPRMRLPVPDQSAPLHVYFNGLCFRGNRHPGHRPGPPASSVVLLTKELTAQRRFSR